MDERRRGVMRRGFNAVTASHTRRRVVRLLLDGYLFVRFSVFGFTALLPLLGALSVTPGLSLRVLIGLLGVALCFHAFAYVLNDVVDLDVDRHEAQRAEDPLVQGRVQPGQALAFALAQVPLTFLIGEWLGVEAITRLALLLSFAGLTVYNLWGKRCRVPLITDAVQALGWCGLVLFGALAVGKPGTQTIWLAAAVVAYVMLINGVHGGLRDLANDIARGARTTAIYLGAGIGTDRRPQVPPIIVVYAVGWQAIMFACVLLAAPTPSTFVWIPTVVLPTAMLGCALILALTYRARNDSLKAMTLGTWHLYACMALLGLPFLTGAAPTAIGAVALVYALPILAVWRYRAVAMGIR